MSKKDKTQEAMDSTLLDALKRLEKQLEVAEKARKNQVDELLEKQAELMSDIADLLCRCVR